MCLCQGLPVRQVICRRRCYVKTHTANQLMSGHVVSDYFKSLLYLTVKYLAIGLNHIL